MMNIVIVDDDCALLRSLELLLSELGHEVVGFFDPVTASVYLSSHDDIDVLLLDYMMQGMNGDELLYRVMSSGHHPEKTILITGHCEEVELNPVLQSMEIQEIICKPLDLKKLCEIIAA